jgi:hypothetical protein
MNMKQTVSEYDFVEAFDKANRKENFSRQGRRELYDYLTEVGLGMGEEIELDVITLCCEFTEYESVEAFNEAYGTKHEDWEAVHEETLVIEFTHEDYFADGASVMEPHITHRAIVQDY